MMQEQFFYASIKRSRHKTRADPKKSTKAGEALICDA